IGDFEALARIRDGVRGIRFYVVEPREPIEDLRQARLVVERLGQWTGLLQIYPILLDVLPGQRHSSKLDGGVDLPPVSLGRRWQSPSCRQGFLVVAPRLGVGVMSSRAVPGKQGILDRLVRSVTPDVVVRENCRLFLEPIAVKVLHRSANASVKFPPSQCEETL